MMKNITDYISESILSSTNAGKNSPFLKSRKNVELINSLLSMCDDYVDRDEQHKYLNEWQLDDILGACENKFFFSLHLVDRVPMKKIMNSLSKNYDLDELGLSISNRSSQPKHIIVSRSTEERNIRSIRYYSNDRYVPNTLIIYITGALYNAYKKEFDKMVEKYK